MRSHFSMSERTSGTGWKMIEASRPDRDLEDDAAALPGAGGDASSNVIDSWIAWQRDEALPTHDRSQSEAVPGRTSVPGSICRRTFYRGICVLGVPRLSCSASAARGPRTGCRPPAAASSLERRVVADEDVGGADAPDRRVEGSEQLVGDARGDLGAVAPGQRVFVRHERAAGLPTDARDRVPVDGAERCAGRSPRRDTPVLGSSCCAARHGAARARRRSRS